jgi:hypothetical protein
MACVGFGEAGMREVLGAEMRAEIIGKPDRN